MTAVFDLIRVSKIIAQSGLYSRHEADKLIACGKVAVNGVIIQPGHKVNPKSNNHITVNGLPLAAKHEGVYKFYKPYDVLSTYEGNGRKCLSSFNSLKKLRLGYSGRLDRDSEGLMIFSADGDIIYRLQRREYGVEKEYIVTLKNDISDAWIKILMQGITYRDEQYMPCFVQRLTNTADIMFRVILTEGKKRQVRHMFKHAGSEVIRLLRVRIGSVTIKGMQPGDFEKLSVKEEEELVRCIKLK